jgi:hypothetical protein
MTRNKIEHMWKVANNDPNHDTNWHDPAIEAFAKLVRADELEACAKICDEYDVKYDVNTCDTAEGIALQIRARGQA